LGGGKRGRTPGTRPKVRTLREGNGGSPAFVNNEVNGITDEHLRRVAGKESDLNDFVTRIKGTKKSTRN